VSAWPEGQHRIAAGKRLQAGRQTPIVTPSGPVHATVSIFFFGGVAFAEQTGTAAEILGRADVALQEAKRSGRNCLRSFLRLRRATAILRRRAAMMSNRSASALKDRPASVIRLSADLEARGRTKDRSLRMPILRLGGDRAPSFFCAGRVRPGCCFDCAPAWMRLVIAGRSIELADLSHALRHLAGDHISAVTASDAVMAADTQRRVKGKRPDMATRLIVELTETVELENIEETARFGSALRALACAWR